jgi:hypothetical protein
MTSSYRRLLWMTGLLAAALVPSRAEAATETYCSFSSSLTTFTLNQGAFFTGSKIRLTDALANDVGSAYLTTPLSIGSATSVSAYFRFEIGPNAAGGDGLAFVLQNAGAGAAALGAGGDDLGYATSVTPSVVVKFDTSLGNTKNYVALMLDGSTTVTAPTTLAYTPMAGAGMLYAWVDYDGTGQTISIYLSNTATKPPTPNVTHALNLYAELGNAGQMYVGFSAATGAGTTVNDHDIYELEVSTDGIPCTCEGDSACSTPTPACDASGICVNCVTSADCPAATPVCDTPVNKCVDCLANTDCGATTPICSTSTDTCGPCQSNTDCVGSATGPVCVLPPASNQGACVICASNGDCPAATPRCNASNTCVQCLAPSDCGGDTPICDAEGICEPCASDADCSGATPACEVWGACGQCSSTNTTQCTSSADAGSSGGADAGADSSTGMPKRICDFPSGTCVACESNADCSGMTPRCDTTSHTCQPCQTNADCVGNLSGPACETAPGMKQGSCVICALNTDCPNPEAPVCDTVSNQCVNCLQDTDCPAATPKCSGADICVGCLTSTDCSVAKPVCDPSDSQCKACANDYSTTNPGPLSCPTSTLPACQPPGSALAGECGVCSSVNDSLCVTQQATPVCITSSATCGCVNDSDCVTNSYCDTSTTATGVCTPGCRLLEGGVDNCQTGYYCKFGSDGGVVGTCTSQPCNSNANCSAPLAVCDTIAQPHVCVACLNNSDCTNSQVCDTTNKCVQCTTQQTKNCTASGTGSACLSSETCGCATDSNCGGTTSGRVCDTTKNACETGCRGTGGNGCPSPLTCTSKNSSVGQCETVKTPDAGKGHDAGIDSGRDATTGVDASQGQVITQSVGGGCRAAPHEGEGEQAGALGGILLGLALAVRRRRSR